MIWSASNHKNVPTLGYGVGHILNALQILDKPNFRIKSNSVKSASFRFELIICTLWINNECDWNSNRISLIKQMGEPESFWGVTVCLILEVLCVCKVAEEFMKSVHIISSTLNIPPFTLKILYTQVQIHKIRTAFNICFLL